MMKNKSIKTTTILFATALLFVAVFSQPTSALISQNVASWFSVGDTNVAASATGDVNGDSKTEIVTAGYSNDGVRWVTQLAVWNGSTLALENIKSWYWTTDTQISSVAIANITGSSALDIVIGGSYFDGTRWVAQLTILNGSSLALENVRTWYWTSDTQIASVVIANITHGTTLDIITGGAYFDGTRWVAQLAVWNSSTLSLENVAVWYWSQNTYINSVAVGDIIGNGTLSIVTGGSYFDGTHLNAQLIVWNATTLSLNYNTGWFWTSNTKIKTIAVANITGGTALSIATGGSYFDLTNYNAQLAIWNGSNLALQNVNTWLTTSNTTINSVAIGNYSSGTNLDVITGSTFNDGAKNNAQLTDWNGGTLALISTTNWAVTSDTQVNSVGIANFSLGNRLIAAGQFYDNVRANGLLGIWG
jgi:hypothetical protein